MSHQSRRLTVMAGTRVARVLAHPATTARSRHLMLAVLLFANTPARAGDTPTGLWLTQNRDGVIKISACDGGLCAEIAGVFLDHPTDSTPVDYRGVSQCHLRLITDAKPIRPNLWKGHILDPRNGSIFGVELHLDPHRNLALRGFLGVPLYGETQTWTRYTGQVPDDCRLPAGTKVAAKSRTLPSGLERAR
jgi:uncharacterized protein (DUF2147 family)